MAILTNTNLCSVGLVTHVSITAIKHRGNHHIPPIRKI